MKLTVALVATALPIAAASSPAYAQRAAPAPALQASSRAATAVCLSNQCRWTDTSALTIMIEYGQPHARGRQVWQALAPLDSVWRLGANAATHLVTKVPLTIGGTRIPAGKYTLHLLPTATAGQLIVSDTTGVWGTPYIGSQKDRARIPMRSRNLAENIETLLISLVPGTAPNSGVLLVVWGRREFTVDWTAQVPTGRAGQPSGG